MLKRQILAIVSIVATAVMIVPISVNGAAPTTADQTVSYNLYFGDLHTHTTYSDAWEGVPSDAYAAGKTGGADFLATTDHHYYLTSEEWAMTQQMADEWTSSDFVAIAGYEFWAPGSGELNVYNTLNMPPALTSSPANHGNPGNRAPKWDALPTLYDWLATQPGAVAQWNHPYYMTKDYSNYAYWSESRDQAIGMIEVFNTKICESSYIMALDNGWHVMPTANSDTHSPDWISGYEFRTALLAPSLTRANLYDAMSAGRGYGTLDKNLQISYTVNGAVMGSVIPVSSKYVASVHIEDPDGIPSDAVTLVEIVSDGGKVVASLPTDGTIVDWTVNLGPGNHYYYLRVTTESGLDGLPGVTAWTAPIWTGS